MAKKVSAQIKGDTQLRKVARMMETEWKRRAQSVIERVTHDVAKAAHEEVLQSLPSGEGLDDLKNAILFGQVTGTAEGEAAYAVYTDVQPQEMSVLKKDAVLIYVKAISAPILIPDSIKVLEEYSPWTVDSLPYFPEKRYAVLVYRKSRLETVAKIQEDREKDYAKWSAALQRAGIRSPKRPGRDVSSEPEGRALPDLAYESLSLEFGMNGSKSKPHWRPAILHAIHQTLPHAVSCDEVVKALLDPSYDGWEEPVDAGQSISDSQAADYEAFQNTLGIRGG